MYLELRALPPLTPLVKLIEGLQRGLDGRFIILAGPRLRLERERGAPSIRRNYVQFFTKTFVKVGREARREFLVKVPPWTPGSSRLAFPPSRWHFPSGRSS